MAGAGLSSPKTRPVEAIYLLAHKYYMRQTQICVASIRYWYPDIPIYLIKDKIGGDFSTREIERAWDVRVFPASVDKFGWGFAHLEPLLKTGGERALVMDVDIVFAGPVLDLLATCTEDMIVHREDQPEEPGERFTELYFSLERLRKYDPDFRFPRFSFNAGQFVVNTGILSRDDFHGLIDWQSPRSVIRGDIFSKGDQGVFNYVVMKKFARGELTVARIPFMVWNPEEMQKFDISLMNKESPYRELIHWAGLRRERMNSMPRADILRRFELLYYSRIPHGATKQRILLVGHKIANLKSKAIAKLRGRHPYLYLT